ncbi:hypothetical protein DM02DRAFT_540904 [Periconia macrospinosa]|uniref:Uncharacterized protein n=1 Tax=Periconia macrospinosa TaxID=97972 RepID=A0A2V1D893_9PLEO|nr:hypothetical protein DM02DRAFT_540904 [Periconia macrospinosa]
MKGFDALIASLAGCPTELKKEISARGIENMFARFKIWCGNLGALQRGRSSLDVRLRGSIVMRDTVMRFLGQLKESLDKSTEITTGLRTPWEGLEQFSDHLSKAEEAARFGTEDGEDEESDSSDEDNSELAERQSEIDDTITHLYRLSFKMRNASYRSLSTRALSTKIVDQETGVDLFSSFAIFDHQHVLESLRQLRQGPQSTSSG